MSRDKKASRMLGELMYLVSDHGWERSRWYDLESTAAEDMEERRLTLVEESEKIARTIRASRISCRQKVDALVALVEFQTAYFETPESTDWVDLGEHARHIIEDTFGKYGGKSL